MWFRMAFDQAAIGMAITRQDGAWVKVNRALAAILGYTEEELLERTFQSVTHPDDLHASTEIVRRALAGEIDRWQMEKRYIHKDGRTVWVALNVAVVREQAEGPLYFLAQMKDISDRRQAEALLRESESRSRQLVEFSPDGIAVHADGRFRYANPAMARLLGYDSPGELIGMSVIDTVHPDGQEVVRERMAAVATGLRIPLREHRLLRRDGTTVDVESTAVSTSYEGVPAVQIVVRDIAERKRAADALRASESRFRALAESLRESEERFRSLSVCSPVGIFHSDAEGNITYYNPRAQQIWGIGETEGLGRGWIPRIHPDDVNGVITGWLGALQAQVQFEHSYRLLMPDGTIRWVHGHSAPVLDANGKMTGTVGTIDDITEHRALEAQLRQAQKMEAVGQLAGGVAHDFNNLLTVIKLHVELALDGLEATHPLHGDLSEVAKAAERAARLTRQLLAFSRKQLLQPKVLRLNEVVAGLVPMLQRVIGEDIHVVTSLDRALGPVFADPGQLEQVLVNLAVNARDAMAQGGTLGIATSNAELDARHPALRGMDPGRYVVLSVADTGCGMTREIRERIFEPFFTTKGPGQGTGLGLSTVYGIVEQSGGSIVVESEPGRGTTFRVYLPEAREEGSPVSAQPPTTERPRGAETILLVEDEDAVRELAKRILQRQGYTVVDARNGRDALSRVASHAQPIDIVVTDMVMPEMNGRALVEELHRSRPGLRVLYMSGYTDDEIVRRGLLDAGVSFLPKPFTADTLARAVRAALGESKR